jgi:hypothetical protein
MAIGLNHGAMRRGLMPSDTASRNRIARWLTMLLLLCVPAASQETEKVEPGRTVLPEAVIQQAYSYHLPAPAGTPPWNWQLISGALPTGLTLTPEGTLTGVPNQTGTYRIQVQAADSATPPHTVTYDIEVIVRPSLEIRWTQPPLVEGDRIRGKLKVRNHTSGPFDLTVIVVAVNEIGKAFALGYQHFSFAPGSQEIPFESSLPRGGYVVHADAIGEVAAPPTIFRARLQTPEPLVVP